MPIHLLADAEGMPVTALTIAGNADERKQVPRPLDGIEVNFSGAAIRSAPRFQVERTFSWIKENSAVWLSAGKGSPAALILFFAWFGGLAEQLRDMRKMLPEEGNIITKPERPQASCRAATFLFSSPRLPDKLRRDILQNQPQNHL